MSTDPSTFWEPSSDRHTGTGALYSDAARDHQLREAGAFHRQRALRHQHVHDGVDEGAGDVLRKNFLFRFIFFLQ